MITNVCMLVLKQHDLVKGIEFYQSIGLRLKFHLKDSWAEFEIGGVKVGLCPTSQEPTDRVSGIVFQVSNLRQFYKDHKDTVFFKGEPVEKVHGIMATIKDPSGNLIDLYEPTPQKVQDLVKRVVEEDKQGGQTAHFGDAFTVFGQGGQA
jgi:hypothetical protein